VADREPTTRTAPRRRYDNSRRREQADATRERIVSAGVELARRASVRDWGGLTIGAVAERAGVSERTVYRHVQHERGLRDAVMRRLEEDAGIDLATMELDDVAEVATRISAQVASFAPGPAGPSDPTLSEAGRRQREALRRAVAARTGGWSAVDREAVAAVLDVLWSPMAMERLAGWDLDREQAVGAVAWAIGLVERAVREEAPPSQRPLPPATSRARPRSGRSSRSAGSGTRSAEGRPRPRRATPS
jgi:AcrR family transcriptional regulator